MLLDVILLCDVCSVGLVLGLEFSRVVLEPGLPLDLDGNRVELLVLCFLDFDGYSVVLCVPSRGLSVLDLYGSRFEPPILFFLSLPVHWVTFLRGCGQLIFTIVMSESPERGKAQSYLMILLLI